MVTGYFGLLTKNAVIRFQLESGIRSEYAVGIVGPVTRALLNKLIITRVSEVTGVTGTAGAAGVAGATGTTSVAGQTGVAGANRRDFKF